jgi:radical SAM protein with 4Fe4S-binding SPASM domain
VKDRVQIYFRNIFGAPSFWDKSEPMKESDMRIDGSKERPDLSQLFQQAQDEGFRVLLTQYRPRGGYCEADYLGNFVVDLHGNIHKCTVGFDEEHRVGRILPGGESEIDHALLAEWVVQDPLNRPDCKDCVLLPLCLGGCAFGKICNKDVTGCNSVMNSDKMTKDLILLYNNIQMEQTRDLTPVDAMQQAAS